MKLALVLGVQYAGKAIVSRLVPFLDCRWGCHLCCPSTRTIGEDLLLRMKAPAPQILRHPPQVTSAPFLSPQLQPKCRDNRDTQFAGKVDFPELSIFRPRKGRAPGAHRDAGSGTRPFAVSLFAPNAEGSREDDEIGSLPNCLVPQLETRNDYGADAGHHAPCRLTALHGAEWRSPPCFHSSPSSATCSSGGWKSTMRVWAGPRSLWRL